MRRTPGAKKWDTRAECKLLNEEVCSIYSSPNTVSHPVKEDELSRA
jgi:hypothetical protein